MPTFGSLFAGIGGIDLGLERAGWTGRWQVEYDPFCTRVLEKHWPDVTRYGDITEVDWSGVEPVDLIAGGFPCQPFSLAGQRKGKDDSRWLWPAFADAIRALRPGLVLVENVPGLLAGHGGMGAVLGDLAELGYDAEWDSVPAAAVGAPHLRYRVWIVAHATRGGRSDWPSVFGGAALGGSLFGSGRGAGRGDHAEGVRGQEDRGSAAVGSTLLAHADSGGWDGRSGKLRSIRRGELADSRLGDTDSPPTNAHASEGRSRGATCEPSGWRTEPDVGRVAHGVPSRVDRLRSLGNAVVPQVVEVIGRQLLASMEAAA